MKNLTKRTKILLAIAGVVIVVVVAGLVLLGPGETALFGASALQITPSNPAMWGRETLVLTVNAAFACNWFSSNSAVVSFTTTSNETKTIVVKANAAGQATIEARCGVWNLNHVSTLVTVYNQVQVTPASPTIAVGQSLQLSSGGFPDCAWVNENNSVASNSPSLGGTTTVLGLTAGSAQITVFCKGADGNLAQNSTTVTVR